MRTRRSDRLLSVLSDYRAVAVVTHDTPDPDAIASGWAIHRLVRERLGLPSRLLGGGAIVRAENVYMVKLLRPPLELVDSFSPSEEEAVVLADCSAGENNQLVAGGEITPVAVIDHHNVPGKAVRVRFRDLRPKAAATALIVSGYLREQGVDPGRELATALYYAAQTEVVATPVRFSRVERGLLAWLGEWVDHQALREISDAPRSRGYYGDLVLAIGNTFIYRDAAFSMLPDAGSPEIVGEVADLLIRCEGVRRVLCGAAVKGKLVFSARTKAGGGNAVSLLGGALRGVGHWGGHPHRAGGRIVGDDGKRPVPQSLIDEVKSRWLKACGADDERGVRLVARRGMLDIL